MRTNTGVVPESNGKESNVNFKEHGPATVIKLRLHYTHYALCVQYSIEMIFYFTAARLTMARELPATTGNAALGRFSGRCSHLWYESKSDPNPPSKPVS